MFKIIIEQEKDNFAKFVLEPLEGGFGHTLGNSLRRTLLTSLQGSAISLIKIEGVSHQFSAIDGVLEDVIEIILNLKKVRVKVFSDPIKLYIKVSGKKEIKAKDIEIEGNGEIVTLDQHIATLTKNDSKLKIDMVAEQGRGYSTAEERKSGEIGMIPIDALFSPVVAANYSVQPTRVGRRGDFDSLTLEITTDGTIKPKEALDEAAKALSDNFKQIYEPIPFAEEEPKKNVISEEVLQLTVDELDLPVRVTNALKAVDINTLEDLINASRVQLLKAKNLGQKSLSLISEKLLERGLRLRET